MTKLRPIAALNFPDIQPDAELGPAPQLRLVSPTDLLVDETYQRDLSPQSVQLIRRIVGSWRWRAFKPPIVVSTEEGLHVIDGQHTAIAAATHPEIQEIPVLIVEAADRQSRAESFVRHNRDRLQVTGTQMHHALVAAGDETALTIERVCQRAGARVVRYATTSDRWLVGDTMAVEALRALVNRRHARGAREVLQVCVEARMAPVTAAFLKAVEAMLFAPEFTGAVLAADIATTIRAMGPQAEKEAVVLAVAQRLPRWRALAAILFRNTRKVRSHGRRAAA
ncbi:hypothetical protein ABID82_005233 [Methylobacterium sp. PvP062]|uniref:ParB/Sulfiredoxin domain-containing protein n=1 Tax=Methylobacterium radiotolerans TaxID=31998 RepID=A0ABV2NQ39_9HYPH|nr:MULTISPECIES: DUF6551 family protein [unclassified Methylobacterium]MBP2494642.1 hypothetical protein [Methylobacterium sp. PvP105]MBP2505487.1 hypothetical protein [Methylobacterium sp. PvP109]MCX7330115.1 hypothetical protein [Hyphomicrobiales bacterium]